MPLMAKMHGGLHRVNSRNSVVSLPQHSHHDIYEYENFVEGDEDAEMSDGSILNRPRPKKTRSTPMLPMKSALRASRILENLDIELKNLEEAACEETKEQAIISDPHEMYLSSEDDAASESTDDYDESIIELDVDRVPLYRMSSNSSSEDTARIVSFMFAGKPQLVDIFSHDRSNSSSRSVSNKAPSSSASSQRRPSLHQLGSHSSSSTATSSSNSLPTSSSSPSISSISIKDAEKKKKLNRRNSSMLLPTLSNMSTAAFLTSDPFPASSNTTPPTPMTSTNVANTIITMPDEPETQTYQQPPKTPTSALKNTVLRSLSFSRQVVAKHKPSISRLNTEFSFAGKGITSATASLSGNPDSTTSQSFTPARFYSSMTGNRAERERYSTDSEHDRASTDLGTSIRYEDIMRSVSRAPLATHYEPTTPDMSASPKQQLHKAKTLGLGMGLGFGGAMKRKNNMKRDQGMSIGV